MVFLEALFVEGMFKKNDNREKKEKRKVFYLGKVSCRREQVKNLKTYSTFL